MKGWIAFAVAATLAVTSSFAYADELKIGIVDISQVLQKSPLMISMNNVLNKKFKQRQDDISNATKQLQDEINQLSYNSSTMSQEDKNKLQNKIITDKANVQILTASFQRDIAIAKDQDMRVLMAKFNSVISKIAEEGHYDLIEQHTDALYVNSKIDLTQEVLKQVS